MSHRIPILPAKEKGWSNDANQYRQSLHEDLYPKGLGWTPVISGVTHTGVTGEYVSMGLISVFGILIEGSTASSAGAYIDLPFAVSQVAVFSVAVGGLIKPAVVDKGQSRLYLPEWNPSARAVLSGVVVS